MTGYSSVEPRLESGCRELGIPWTPRISDPLRSLYELLIERNTEFNLTRITEPGDVVDKHFLDSLSLLKAVDLTRPGLKLADVGTGAGFPGLPLAIAFPNLNVMLIDSTGKKIRFVQEAIAALGLSNARAVQGRAEELGRPPAAGRRGSPARPGGEFYKAFDIVVARAVAKLDELLKICMPLVKPGGVFIAMKSQECNDELVAAQKKLKSLGVSRLSTIDFILPGTNLARRLIVA